jgi:hypothetical protein
MKVSGRGSRPAVSQHVRALGLTHALALGADDRLVGPDRVPPAGREALRRQLKQLLCVPFAFSSRGSRVVVYEPREGYDKALASELGIIYHPEVSGVGIREETQ